MTFHLLLIMSGGMLVSTTLIGGAMDCGNRMPDVIAALEVEYGVGQLDGYCEDTGIPTVRPQVRPW